MVKPSRKALKIETLIALAFLAICSQSISRTSLADAATTQPAASGGATISYVLPTDGALPRTYRVTLAIVDAKNPDWIISQFASGVVRTVTAENKGRFSETWNGLDDNFMPVPPGEYGVKGICMPASKWAVDGEYHSITPRFVTGASSWMPDPKDIKAPEPFGGDPTDAPLTSVAVGANGMAVFHWAYLENGTNNPVFDLNKPIGPGQFVKAFGSGGAAGGPAVATDGVTIWSVCHEGGPEFVYRPDGKPFGNGAGAYRKDVYRPEGEVTGIVAVPDPQAHKTWVCLVERGRLIESATHHGLWEESTSDFIDRLVILDGDDGKLVATVPLHRPRALTFANGTLYAMREGDAAKTAYEVDAINLQAGKPLGQWKTVLKLPEKNKPFDLAVDHTGDIFVSDPAANHIYRFAPDGMLRATIGKLDAQEPGHYDPNTLMNPGKMALWTDVHGMERLIVVENAGPNRAAEWTTDGKLVRGFVTLQTRCNNGYAIEEEHRARPQLLFVDGQAGWLLNFEVDRERRSWKLAAVWPYKTIENAGFPNVGDGPHLQHPFFASANGGYDNFLVSGRGYAVYRFEGNRLLLSAGLIRKRTGDVIHTYSWHDVNGNEAVDPDELTLLNDVPGTLRYHGEQWLDDLSMLSVAQGGQSVWRLAAAGFDARGNPIFKQWEKLLTDSVFVARQNNTADATHGGNELDDRYSSDWAMADGTMKDGFYVIARGGKNRSANFGVQEKLSYYAADAAGGFKLKWRTGRQSLGDVAEPGEIVGAIHLHRPINGVVSVIDQTRCGIVLYTKDGLYVDTLFPDGRALGPQQAGVYSLPGEFFAGSVVPDGPSGKIILAMGKYTPMLYEADGWSMDKNPVQALAVQTTTVSLRADRIASPTELAIAIRGGASTARIAQFAPALGGANLDGSMFGWDAAQPVSFAADSDRTIEVRGLYDADHIYLRWHARIGHAFVARSLEPAERIFTHDRGADTLGFYIQGDPAAPPSDNGAARAGDVRLVFGLFDDNGQTKPVALGMYPQFNGAGSPQTYATAAGGKASYANVARLLNVALQHRMDEDGKGFVLTAAIPRSAIPGLPRLTDGVRTLVNFDANLGGHNRFWWADRDGSASRETYDEPTEARLYPGSWAPAQFIPLGKGVPIRNWIVAGPFGGPGAEKFNDCPNCGGHDSSSARKLFDNAIYPPDDQKIDPNQVFTGDAIHGWWPDPREVRWTQKSIADLDTRVEFSDGAKLWYAASWVYAPTEMQLDFQFQGRPQTYLRYFLNGDKIFDGEIKEGPSVDHIATRRLALRAGWNRIFLRAYCVGYPPFRAGLVLAGEPDQLWRLKFTSEPRQLPAE